MLALLKFPSSRVSAGAAIALGNYMALQRVNFYRAMTNRVMEIACEVIAAGEAEAKRGTAFLMGGILGIATQEELQGSLSGEVIETFLDAVELDDAGLICHVVGALAVLLPEFPWIAIGMVDGADWMVRIRLGQSYQSPK
jgi:hypothetical protein